MLPRPLDSEYQRDLLDQFKRGEVKKCLVMKPEDWKPPPRWEGPRFPERI